MKKLLTLLVLLPSIALAQPGRLSPQGGTITGVVAGNGLTGGGTGGSVTLDVVCEGTGLICGANSISIDTAVVPAGSGTTNTFTMWTGANTLGDAPMTYNGSTTVLTPKLVGIGDVTSPAGQLDVGINADATTTQVVQLWRNNFTGQNFAVNLGVDSAKVVHFGTTSANTAWRFNNSSGVQIVRLDVKSGNTALTVTGPATIIGTSDSSYFMLGANEDTHIRSGKAAGAVWIGDNANASVGIGGNSTPTTVYGNSIFGDASTDTTVVYGRFSTGHSTFGPTLAGTPAVTFNTGSVNGFTGGVSINRASNDANAANLYFYKTRNTDPNVQTTVANGDVIGSQNYFVTDGTTIQQNARIRAVVNGAVSAGVVPTDIVFQTSATNTAGLTTACTITSGQVMNCVGGLQVNGTSVLTTSNVSGTTGTIPKFIGTNSIGDSAILTSTSNVRQSKESSVAGFDVGDDTNVTTDVQNGLRFTAYSDGNNYVDFKTFTSGSTITRIGSGAQTGANTTYSTIAHATGATTWSLAHTFNTTLGVLGNTTLGDAQTDTVGILGAVTITKTSGQALAVNSGSSGYSILTDGDNVRFNQLVGYAEALRDFYVGGNATIGDAPGADTHTVNGRFTGSTTTFADGFTWGLSGTAAAYQMANTITTYGTVDTTAANRNSFGLVVNNTATESGGSNFHDAYGIYATASGATGNHYNVAGQFTATGGSFGGDFGIISNGTNFSFFSGTGALYNAGSIQTDGNTTLGNATTDEHVFTGGLDSEKSVGALPVFVDTAYLANLTVTDTTAMGAGVGGMILFRGNYLGSAKAVGGGIKLMKDSAVDGEYGYDLVLAARANGAAVAEGCRLIGASKILNCVGGLQVNGTSVVTTAAVSGTTNTLAMFTGANAVGNSSLVYNGTQTLTWTKADGGSHSNRPIVAITNSTTSGSFDHRAELQFNTYDAGNVSRQSTIVAEGAGMGINLGATGTGLTITDDGGNALSSSYRNLTIVDSTSAAAGVGGMIAFQGAYTGTTVTSAAAIKAMKSNGSGGDFSFDLAFGTRVNGSGDVAERMRILAGGNVGIWTTSPGVALQVGDGTSTGAQLFINGAQEPNYSIRMDSTSLPASNGWQFRIRENVEGDFSIYDETNSAHRMYFDNDGDVAVGAGVGPVTSVFQVKTFPADGGSFSLASWNGTGNKVSAFIKSATNNGGQSGGYYASEQKVTEPALVLGREGVSGEAYANFVEFKVGRAQNAGVATGGSSIGVEARSKLDIALTQFDGDAAGTNVLSLLSAGQGGTYTILAPSFKKFSLTSAAGMLTSLGTANSTFASVADIGVSGARSRNFARASDYLDDTNAPDAYSGYFTPVNYPGVLSLTVTNAVSPRGVYEAVGFLDCTLATCSADFRTQLNYASSRTGIKDVRGRTFTYSVWAKRESGTGQLGLSAAKYADNDTFISQICNINSTTWTRCVATGTTNTTSRTDNSELRFYMSTGSGTSDIGVYLYGVQIEEGGQVTPYVRGSDQLNTLDVAQTSLGVGGYAYSGTNGTAAVYAKQPGSSGNGYTITFSTGGAAGGTFTDGRDATYSYQAGVTTTADFCTDLGSSDYMVSVYCPTSPVVITATGAYTLTGAEDAHVAWTHRASFGGDASDPWVIMNVGHSATDLYSIMPADNRIAKAAMQVGLPAWGGASQPFSLTSPSWTDARGWFPSADHTGAPYEDGAGFRAMTVNGLAQVNGSFGVNNTGDANTFSIYQNITGLDPACSGCNTADTAYIQLTGTHGTASQTGTALYITNDMADNSQTGTTNRGLIISVLNADTNTALHVTDGDVLFADTLEVTGRFESNNDVYFGCTACETLMEGDLVVENGGALNGPTWGIGSGTGDSVITLYNTPIGINGYGGKHLEWADEWTLSRSISSDNAMFGSIYWTTAVGAGNSLNVIASTGRPGVIGIETGTATTGQNLVATNTDTVAFNKGNWTYEAVVGIPVLSDGTNTYAVIIGFQDSTTINEVDGCYFAYDQGDVMANPGTGDTGGISGNNWSIWCSQNSTRTGYKLDGTASEDSFTTITSTVAAVTWSTDTNIYHLKIVMEGTTKARFYIDEVEVGRITTNIPNASTRMTGAGINIVKSAGATERQVEVDWTRVAYDMTTLRSN